MYMEPINIINTNIIKVVSQVISKWSPNISTLFAKLILQYIPPLMSDEIARIRQHSRARGLLNISHLSDSWVNVIKTPLFFE